MKVAFLTSGGIAPCLSSSIAKLIKSYVHQKKDIEFYGYLHGFKGLLLDKKIKISIRNFDNLDILCNYGGTFLGNSRVKLTNIEDCIKKGYINKRQTPLEVAANQLLKDKIDIFHPIGGDDTNATASDLVDYLKINKKYNLTVVGMPKTIDNDVSPISQTLGALTAAEESAKYFSNIVNENTTSSRQLIIHEVMGRNCGWLTAYSAFIYLNDFFEKYKFLPELGLNKEKWSIHGIYIPEISFNLEEECNRLKDIMDKYDCVNIFLSEGAGIENIIEEKERHGDKVKRDAFGHVRLDELNPGEWYGQYFKNKLKCDKVLVQKSGYFSRSSSPNVKDLELIQEHADYAVKVALEGTSGVVGIDDKTKKLTCIPFNRIKGGKPFNVKQRWFINICEKIQKIS